MRETAFLGSLAALYLPVLLSPGPSFLMLSKTAVTESRHHSLLTAIGISSASILFATLAVTGIGLVAVHSPHLQTALQIAGGAYLLYKGVNMMWRAAPLTAVVEVGSGGQSLWQAYCNGLLTNLTNPHALVFFTTIFATLLASDLQGWAKPASVALVATLSISVNLLTVALFSFAGIQQHYLRAKKWIDRGAGLLLGTFGFKLLRLVWQ